MDKLVCGAIAALFMLSLPALAEDAMTLNPNENWSGPCSAIATSRAPAHEVQRSAAKRDQFSAFMTVCGSVGARFLGRWRSEWDSNSDYGLHRKKPRQNFLPLPRRYPAGLNLPTSNATPKWARGNILDFIDYFSGKWWAH